MKIQCNFYGLFFAALCAQTPLANLLNNTLNYFAFEWQFSLVVIVVAFAILLTLKFQTKHLNTI